jgi:DNA-binding NtrC family response regulator
VDAALLDLNYARDTTSGGEGMSLISELTRRDSTLPVVVMTAWGSVEGAVEALQRGARDYVCKPWDNSRLVATMRAQVELGRALRQVKRAGALAARQHLRGLPEMIAASEAMAAIHTLVDRIAPSRASVLVTGEHGTGKEVVARRIHAASNRAGAAFVPVNAGALGDGVLESELFGHVRGAFTDAKRDRIGCFELAEGGTLFLDEIANMPMAQQAKLLRVLQTGEYHPVGSSRLRHADVRVITATNADIAARVQAGAFREDLLYRLNTVEILLPPLRGRSDDIAPLALSFLARLAPEYGRPGLAFGHGVLDALTRHAWPGNVRELEHAVERSVLMASGTSIEVSDLGLRPGRSASTGFDEMTLADAEEELIRRAMARNKGNVAAAAEQLGLSRSALYRRLG